LHEGSQFLSRVHHIPVLSHIAEILSLHNSPITIKDHDKEFFHRGIQALEKRWATSFPLEATM